MSVFKLFAVGSAAAIFLLLFVVYAQPHVKLIDRGEWLPFPDDMSMINRNFTCSLTECRYVNKVLHYYVPHYYAEVTVYEPAIGYIVLVVGTLLMVSVAYFASRIEDMPTKKAVAIAAGVYGAGMVALMMMRKDFRAAAPILAPLAAALMASAFILILLLRASGHDIPFKVNIKKEKVRRIIPLAKIK